MCVCVHINATMYTWQSQHNLQETVIFFSIMWTLDQTQVVRLGGKWLYPWAISPAPKSSILFLWNNPRKCSLTEDSKNRTLYTVCYHLCSKVGGRSGYTAHAFLGHLSPCFGEGHPLSWSWPIRLLWLASEPQGSSSQYVWPFSCVLGIELSTMSFLQTQRWLPHSLTPFPLHPLTPWIIFRKYRGN